MSAASEEPVLLLDDVRKSYRTPFGLGRIEVLRGVNLVVGRGETVGFLGPNGAGKTTTLKIIMGLARPDGGTVRVLGRPPSDRNARHGVGFLPEQPYFYDYLTPREILELAAALFALPSAVARKRVADGLELLGLSRVRDTPLRKLSKGWLQRVGLAQALIGAPELVVLDEPMSGLDPVGRREVRELIASLKNQGTSVLLSSHILSDAELLCDRVAVVVGGQIRYQGPLARFGAGEAAFVDLVIDGLDSQRAVPPGLEPLSVEMRAGLCCVRVKSQSEADSLLRHCLEQAGRVVSVTPNRVGLEEIFAQALQGGSAGAP